MSCLLPKPASGSLPPIPHPTITPPGGTFGPAAGRRVFVRMEIPELVPGTSSSSSSSSSSASSLKLPPLTQAAPSLRIESFAKPAYALHFSLDGSEPTQRHPCYHKPGLVVQAGGDTSKRVVLKAVAFRVSDGARGPAVTVTFLFVGAVEIMMPLDNASLGRRSFIKGFAGGKTRPMGLLPRAIVDGAVRLGGSAVSWLRKTVGARSRKAIVDSIKRVAGQSAKHSSVQLTGIRPSGAPRERRYDIAFAVELVEDGDDPEQVKRALGAAGGTFSQVLAEEIDDPAVRAEDIECHGLKSRQLRKLHLDLSWGFPRHHRQQKGVGGGGGGGGGGEGDESSSGGVDFLDGSCLIYAQAKLIGCVDYTSRHDSGCSKLVALSDGTGEDDDKAAQGSPSKRKTKSSSKPNTKQPHQPAMAKVAADDLETIKRTVWHSGDIIDHGAKQGKHKIRVDLADLPAVVTDLVFALSAYNCRNLSKFPDPKIRLFDADCPTYELCRGFSPGKCTDSAMIMCSIRRSANGKSWEALAHGFSGPGTVRDYRPICGLAVPALTYHDMWARRGLFTRLLILAAVGRAAPKAGTFVEQLLARVPVAIIRENIVMYL